LTLVVVPAAGLKKNTGVAATLNAVPSIPAIVLVLVPSVETPLDIAPCPKVAQRRHDRQFRRGGLNYLMSRR
jgi:hypothetical protein